MIDKKTAEAIVSILHHLGGTDMEGHPRYRIGKLTELLRKEFSLTATTPNCIVNGTMYIENSYK